MIEGEVVEIEIDKPVQGTASKTVRTAAIPAHNSMLLYGAMHRPIPDCMCPRAC